MNNLIIKQIIGTMILGVVSWAGGYSYHKRERFIHSFYSQMVSSQKSGVQEITPQRVAQWEKTGRLQPLC